VVLATFTLSHDNDPLTVSFESVSINLLLQPGSYFALFAPQGADQGFLLAQAFSGAGYQAGLIQMGSKPFYVERQCLFTIRRCSHSGRNKCADRWLRFRRLEYRTAGRLDDL